MMMRNDNYLPVPGEDKNLDVDFNGTSKSKESIVSHCIPAIIPLLLGYGRWYNTMTEGKDLAKAYVMYIL